MATPTKPFSIALAALVLAGCGQGVAHVPSERAATGAEARVSTAARDRVAKVLINEYRTLSWARDSELERKQMLLEKIVATGSDLAVDLLIEEYQGLSWARDSELERKQMMLEMIEKMLKQSEKHVFPLHQQSIKATVGPSPEALARAGKALQRDLDSAPVAMRERLTGLVSRILIISNNAGR